MDIALKRLSTTNVSELKALNQLFGAVFQDSASYGDHQPSESYLRDFLADTNNIVIVAMHNQDIVGGLVAYCLTKFEQERKEVYLYDLAVDGELQRQGIGTKLMNELRQIAQSLGAYTVFVQADEGDAAVSFYEALQPTENIKTRNFDFDTEL